MKTPKLRFETAARRLFEMYCEEGIRPLMFNLKQVANEEYASPFTEAAWKIYWRAMNDHEGAF